MNAELVSKYMKEREAKLGVYEEEESTLAFRAELAAMYWLRLNITSDSQIE